VKSGYERPPVSNGNPTEQALTRRWWIEAERSRGRLVWEYHIEGRYVDAVWFPDDPATGVETDGKDAPTRFPLKGADVMLCEAKSVLNPELIGQALVYSVLAVRAHARLRGTVIFAEKAGDSLREVARALGLAVVLGDEALQSPAEPLRLGHTAD
jgi:hypothetical protein